MNSKFEAGDVIFLLILFGKIQQTDEHGGHNLGVGDVILFDQFKVLIKA